MSRENRRKAGLPKGSRQPRRGSLSEPSAVSVGVERLLVLAAADGSFREALLDDRLGAATRAGIVLRPSEEAVLATVSETALAAMIDGIRVPEHGRRRFMKAVAAAGAGTAGLVLVEGCDPASKGVRPDEDAEVQDAVVVDASALEDVPLATGVRPLPPENDRDE
ncbi:MAG: twin-arginine translocation signal domain-containing protein [bacterium]